jgi:hypothetical protein
MDDLIAQGEALLRRIERREKATNVDDELDELRSRRESLAILHKAAPAAELGRGLREIDEEISRFNLPGHKPAVVPAAGENIEIGRPKRTVGDVLGDELFVRTRDAAAVRAAKTLKAARREARALNIDPVDFMLAQVIVELDLRATAAIKRLDEIEARIAEREAVIKRLDEWRDCGVWNRSAHYKANNFVSYDGSSFICTADCLGDEPAASSSWRLCVKRGREGKSVDGRRR